MVNLKLRPTDLRTKIELECDILKQHLMRTNGKLSRNIAYAHKPRQYIFARMLMEFVNQLKNK